MPVTQNNVKSNLNKFFTNVKDKKSVQFVNGVLSAAGNLSKEKAPIEFGTLQNSQRQEVSVKSNRVVGTLSYGTGGVDYAAYLNFDKNWSPLMPALKKGNAWNPNATSGFLEYGFESPEAIKTQNRLLEIFKV